MSTPYYNTPERVAALVAECETWRHTPFGKGPGVKGPRGGVDCIRIFIHLHQATGALGEIDEATIPSYSITWSQHNTTSPLVDWMVEHGWLALDGEGQAVSTPKALVIRDRADLLPGDGTLFAPGKSIHHLETVLGPNKLCGSMYPIGVMIGGWERRLPRLCKTIADTFQYGFRLLE